MSGRAPEFGVPRRIRRAGLAALGLLATIVAADRIAPPDLARLGRVSTLVADVDGEVLRAFTTAEGIWRLPVDPADVDPRYLDMLLAYEDRRFRYHPGIDPLAVARAATQAARHGRVVSGASTITMQTARLFEPRPRTFASKLIEALRAMQLELRYSKREILSFYLTLAPYGGNLEGIRAASLAWFGKEPRHLAPSEAALLVALPQSPESLRPDRYPGRAREARDKVLSVLARRGVLDDAIVAEAYADPVPTARRDMPFLAPHLARRLAASRSGGGLHRTTVDGSLQKALEHLARIQSATLDPQATMAILVVRNEGRAVLGYVGSADFFDATRAGQVDMIRAIRSPGSTLKPFIYGMGFDDLLIHPETVVIDMPTRFGSYRPENFLRAYHGEVSVREALQQSLNVPAVAVLEAIGPPRLDARFRAAGVTPRYAGGEGAPGLPLALGGAGLTLHDLVTLYAGIADGGKVRPLNVVSGAQTSSRGVPIFGEAAAWYVTRILEDAPPPPDFVQPGVVRQRRSVAYKTGTSYGYRDAWAVGYDADHTVGVWTGRPDGSPSPDRFGRATAAPILFQVFGMLSDFGRPANPRRPEGVLSVGNKALPERLKRLAPGDATAPARSLARRLSPPLAVTFPPDGATIRLVRGESGYASLPLTAEGGRRPLRWIVNGHPVAAPANRRRTDWRPDGAGYVGITILDADGQTARSEFVLE